MVSSHLHRSHVPLIDSAFTLLKSSHTLGWDSVLVEHVRLRDGELYVPQLYDHLICMVLDADYHLEQSRNGQTFVHTFQPGQAQLLPVSTSGFWRSPNVVELLHLQFSHHFLQQVAEETLGVTAGQVAISDQFLLQDPQVTHIGYAFLAELRDGGLNGTLYSDALTTALVTHLLRKYGLGGANPAIALPRISRTELGRALDYINDHLGEDVTLSSLAQLVNLSPSHFNALFKQHVGLPPYQYILHQRVSRAKALLIRTNLSIAQVATEVGFYDQSHLTRHMRRLLGITPAALHQQQNIQKPR